MKGSKENGLGGSSDGNDSGPQPVVIARDRLAEGVLKMFGEQGYPHVMLAFADDKGAYWVAHTGTYQVYRLHRLAGVVLDEIQVRLDGPKVAATHPVDPTPKRGA